MFHAAPKSPVAALAATEALILAYDVPSVASLSACAYSSCSATTGSVSSSSSSTAFIEPLSVVTAIEFSAASSRDPLSSTVTLVSAGISEWSN